MLVILCKGIMNPVTKKLIGVVTLFSLPLTLAVGQQIIKDDAEAEEVTSGYQFTEGPLWHSDGYLLFSDIPANTIYQWSPGEEAVEYLTPSGHSNGLAFDQNGQLLLAQHVGRFHGCRMMAYCQLLLTILKESG